jgi:hypothetical protein
MSSEAKVERVREVARISHVNAQTCIVTRTLLEMVSEKQLSGRIEDTAIFVRGLFGLSLAQALMRMYDRVGHGDPMKTNRNSLPVLFKLLDDPQVCAKATARGSVKRMAKVRADWVTLTTAHDKLIDRVRQLRNQGIAHSLNLNTGRFSVSDLKELSGVTVPLVDELMHALGPRAEPLDELWDDWWGRSREFWNAVSRGSTVPPRAGSPSN